MRKEGQFVDVVRVEDLTTIQVAATLVVLDAEWVADLGQIGASDLRIDLVSPCVIDFEAQAMPILLAETNLHAVVGTRGEVAFLIDAGEARESSQHRILSTGEFSSASQLARCQRSAERKRVDGQDDVLMPCDVADVLGDKDQ